MPNLYFIQSGSRLGMLRAVLSRDEGSALLKTHSTEYVGGKFPTEAKSNFALLRIFDEEADQSWRAGFYRFSLDVMQVERSLRDPTATTSPGEA